MATDLKNNSTAYVLTVWISGVLLSPVIGILIDLVSKPTVHDVGFIFTVTLFFGGVLSIPSAILLGIVCTFLLRLRLSILKVKLLLTIAAIPLSFLPFLILNEFRFSMSDMNLLLLYGSTIIAGIWLYRLERYDAE